MTKEEKFFNELGEAIKGAEISKMFGAPALKVKGKAFGCYYEGCIVLKLTGDDHAKALELSDAMLFDPGKMGRPMKEWVVIPFRHQKEWKMLAQAAFDYVNAIAPAVKKKKR